MEWHVYLQSSAIDGWHNIDAVQADSRTKAYQLAVQRGAIPFQTGAEKVDVRLTMLAPVALAPIASEVPF